LTITSCKNSYALKEVLDQYSKSHSWKVVVFDNFQLEIYEMPYYTNGKQLIHLSPQKNKRIYEALISPDYNSIAYYQSDCEENDVNLFCDRYNLVVIDSSGNEIYRWDAGNLNFGLLSFFSPTELLFEIYETENSKINHESRQLNILNLENKNKTPYEVPGVEINHSIRGSYSKNGEVFVSEMGRKQILIYDRINNRKEILEVEGDRPVISPKGDKFVVRRGGYVGDYFIIDIDGKNEEKLLSKKKIRSLLRGSGEYRDLYVFSWSPDGKIILFGEASDLNKNRLFALNLDTKEIEQIKEKWMVSKQ